MPAKAISPKSALPAKKRAKPVDQARQQKSSSAPAPWRSGNVVPDKLDLRDRLYQPPVRSAPPLEVRPKAGARVFDQGESQACTGYALSVVVHHLMQQRGRKVEPVSPFMLFSMARRYDEIPGAEPGAGSTLRGAMKGWYKHGVCALRCWDKLDFGPEGMPPPSNIPDDDWWLDAVHRPLGAYYRVDVRSVSDMQLALSEVGVLYAGAMLHAGWAAENLHKRPGEPLPIIAPQLGEADQGHAFALVGYTAQGFIVQNSWGKDWGKGGFAILSYQDWLANAFDCWVAQLGIVTEQQKALSRAVSLPVEEGVVRLGSEERDRNRAIGPFVVNLANNGLLSNSGEFRTQPSDLVALVTHHLKEARKLWGLKDDQAMHVAIYAHGGLTGERNAAKTAAVWIKAMYEAHIFPIFLMWETDLWSTIKGRLADWVHEVPRGAGGIGEQMHRFWNQRLERLLAAPGSVIWSEMKQNAAAMSAAPLPGTPVEKLSGGIQLYRAARDSGNFTAGKVRLHLIGHSAGAIVHSHLVQALRAAGTWRFESMHLMAPAVRLDSFHKMVTPYLEDGSVAKLHCYNLTDAAEQRDDTCKPILLYGRSLLYLVSESFEQGQRTPLLGMQKYFAADPRLQQLMAAGKVQQWLAPSGASQTTTHGGFDEDAATRAAILRSIQGGP